MCFLISNCNHLKKRFILAKKKKIIDVNSMNIKYEEKNLTLQILFLNTQSMSVDLNVYDKDTFVENKTIPFAHLPKNIKKLLKPV